jgi:pimeloyl-ACP methyl ester carboxylesterase
MNGAALLRMVRAMIGVMILVGGLRCAEAPIAGESRVTESGIYLIPFESDTQQVWFESSDGTALAGQVDWPKGVQNPPLVFIIQHSGPVDRDAYQYLAALLVPEGYAVFRFDKRGNGKSGGSYGCCEGEDVFAAYQAAVGLSGYKPDRVFIIAQSIGTEILARQYDDFTNLQPVRGVVLLSSLLEGEEVVRIESPVFIIVSDSEPDLQAITEASVNAHRQKFSSGASYFIAPHTEHTLFDVSQEPIDWSDPNWPLRFSIDAAESLLFWLNEHRYGGL